MSNYDDPGLRLAPGKRRWLLALIIIGLLIALAWALTDTADAADLAGNGGGCALGNQWTRLDCNVTFFTPGFVSGECDGGLWFRHERTGRTWTLDQMARVTACEVQGDQLTGVPGFRFRISR